MTSESLRRFDTPESEMPPMVAATWRALPRRTEPNRAFGVTRISSRTANFYHHNELDTRWLDSKSGTFSAIPCGESSTRRIAYDITAAKCADSLKGGVQR